MALICLKAPTIEPVSLTSLKLYLQVEHEVDDAIIEGMIKAARVAIEAYTARSLLRQEWRFTLNAGYAHALSDLSYLSGEHSRGFKGIELPRSPFMELLDEPKVMDSYGTRPVQTYRLDQAGRVAKIHFGAEVAQVLNGQGSLQIDFAAGFGMIPDDVPETIRQALMMIVHQLYENRGGVNDNAGLPIPLNDSVVRMLKPYQVQRLL